MKKQGALIQHRKAKIVEKSMLISKNVQLKLDFDVRITAWVPTAQPNKPMPQVNITISCSYDDIRMGCNTTEELINALMEQVAFLEKNKEILNAAAKEQQNKWLDLCNEQHSKLERGLRVVQMKSA
jgi:hypothetical protein